MPDGCNVGKLTDAPAAARDGARDPEQMIDLLTPAW